jgi:steroid delta-isomerase-like uncharacterized protein
MKTPKQVATEWVAAFNARDAAAAVALYHDDAINVQVALEKPARGREEIHSFLAAFFRGFPDNYTTPENLFQDGEWAILEWSGGGTFFGEFDGHEPTGKSFTLRGCGFFHIVDGKIRFQRGYFDRAKWYKQVGLPID